MAVSAKDVMALRQRTGMGMMECKKALAEADGDAEAAVEILRAAAKGKMDERTDRAAAQGTLAVAASGSSIAIIELNCETDFVARNDAFIEGAEKIAGIAVEGADGELAADEAVTKIIDELRITTKENVSFKRGHKLSGSTVGSYVHHNRQVGVILMAEGDADDELLTGVSQHVAAHVPTPQAVDADGLDAADIEAARAGFIQEAKDSGKPEEIAEKMSTGKLKKWIAERTLVGQSYVKDMTGKTTVGDALGSAKVHAFVRYAVGVE